MAVTYDVYFGTVEADVTAFDNTDLTGVFKGNQPGTTYAPKLDAGWQYFWRIDTVDGGGTTKGDTMNFTTIPATLTFWIR
jgi:hypothetical protein